MKRMQNRENAGARKTAAALMHRVALAATIALGVISPEASQGADIKMNVITFGDSLIDVGTYSPVAEAFFRGGIFTTNPGQNFAQLIAASYGSVLTPAYNGGYGVPLISAGGLGYAQGGSRVTQQPGINHATGESRSADFEAQTTIPIKEQVTDFLWTHKRFTPDQLVIMDGGANDILYQLTAAQAKGNNAPAQRDARDAISRSAVDLVDVVATMVENGARRIVLLNMPDLGKGPSAVASADGGQSLTQIAQLFNTTLTSALQQRHFGRKVLLLDAFAFSDQVVANYQQYGFTSNTATACDVSAQVKKATELHLRNPNGYGQALFCSPQTYVSKDADQKFMFADSIHPTTHLNEIYTTYVEQEIAKQGWD
jgi:phospholipase/lecithinase/hemolysin